jgi:hypothetical protein
MITIEIQVKNLKGSIDRLEKYMDDDSVTGIMFSYFDVYEPEEHEIKYKGNKILLSYEDDEDPKDQFDKIKDFCSDYTKFARTTSKMIQKHIKNGGDPKDLSDLEGSGPVDPYFMGAVQTGKFGDAKRPFVYTATMKQIRESLADIARNEATKYRLKMSPSQKANKAFGDNYQLYHKTFSGAMQHSYQVAKKRGYKVSADSIDTQVAFGPRKPSNGKMNSYHLDLDGERNKKLHVQVYNTGNSYELNMYVESMELNERMSRKDFDKLKKGDKIEINYGSTVSSSQTREFSVVNKSRSAKYDVDKVRLQPTDKTGGMKFFLYSRSGGDATLALGDMGASIKSYRLLEEVELEEQSMTDNDWVVVGKGRKPVRFLKNPKNNKAPRNWQKSSDEKEVMRVSKAKQMGIIKKESVELEEKKYSPSDEKDIQKTISIMKKYPANKKKSDKELRDGAIEYLFHNRSMKRKRVETTEGFSAAQLGKLKKAYSTVSTVDPTSPTYKKLTKMIKSQDKDVLMQIAKAKVKFVSQIAATELRRSHNIKLKASEFMEEIEMNESEFKTVRGKDGKKYDVKISMDGKKFKFRVTDKTGNVGAFKVISLGQAAKLFENLEELVDITEESGIELARKIVDKKQHMKGIDLTTAGLILQVYDKVNDKNKAKMDKMSAKQLASVVYKLLSKEEVQEEHDMYGYKLFKEEVELEEATGKEIAALMKKSKTMKGFAAKVAKMKTVTVDDLEDMLPDYVSGGDIRKMFEAHCSSKRMKKEGITDEDVAQFIGAASAAKKAGKKNFSFGGKTYPVTISGDTAKKVLEDSLEEDINEKMDPTEHVEKNKETGMYCVYGANGKKVKEFEDKKEADDYAIKNHEKLMAVKESKYTDIEELIESSDKKDAAEMSKLVKELQPKISKSELKKEVEAMAMEKYKNKTRAKKIASFA